jgi:membrane fusion protein (multidrug efflux system)
MMDSPVLQGGRSPGPRRMTVALIVVVLLVALLVGGVFGWQAFTGSFFKQFMEQAAAAPQTVSTVTAAKASWQAQIRAIGTLRAVRGADLSAQAAGVVDSIEFESGNDVPAGKVLLKLRPNDDYAKLEQLEAAAELAAQTLKRDQEQFAAQAVSQAVIDTDVSTLKAARAQVVAQRLGIRQIDLGQYLAAGTTVVTLQALDPILIDFYVPQEALKDVRPGQGVSANVDTFPGVDFPGVVESINSKVDTASRNVQIRASFKNADHRLVPGMFASVAIDVGAATSEITLPQTAITYNPYGNTVFVVEHVTSGGKPRDTVQQRFVKLGDTRGDQVAVLSGIAPGDVVVSAGQMKLRNGTAIAINNTVQPTDQPKPTPPNE